MSRRPKIIHIGGEKCVTGSCHLLQVKGLNIMVDCGLTQGQDAGASMDSWPVRPDQVDFLFLTHAHIDHIGRLPELIQKGFKGEIIATHATKALLAPMLNDAMGFMSLNDRKIAQIESSIDDLSWGFEYNLSFDLGRTQELLYEMDRLVSVREWQGAFPIFNSDAAVPAFVDTPLGLNITMIYGGLSEFWDREAGELYRKGDHPLKFKGLYGVERSKDHRDLMRIPGPAVIIAGSGMCTGGRIVDHLKAGLPQPENDVCFVGYLFIHVLHERPIRHYNSHSHINFCHYFDVYSPRCPSFLH